MAADNMDGEICEVWYVVIGMCDQIQTDRQTDRHTDTLTAIRFTPFIV